MSTIAAIATAPGRGGVGIVRVSGPLALKILKDVFRARDGSDEFIPWKLRRGAALDIDGEELDDVLAVFMPGPRTYTGEDVFEIHCHGGPVIEQTLLRRVLADGAREAGRGEFTKRAFLNGRMDLSQAEAVAELISAPSREAARQSLARLKGYLGDAVAQFRSEIDELRALAQIGVDFPEDEVPPIGDDEFSRRLDSVIAAMESLAKGAKRAKIAGSGAAVVLVGRPNAGKSSLLNAFLGDDRALVTDIPGTTRDFIEERVDLDGISVRLIDTAGFRSPDSPPADAVEALGVEKSRAVARDADLILIVVDLTDAPDNNTINTMARDMAELSGNKNIILVYNKSDLAAIPHKLGLEDYPAIRVSAKTGENIDGLAALVRSRILEDAPPPENGLAPNARQALILENAINEARALREEIADGLTWDCRLGRLEAIAAALSEITGLNTYEQTLEQIFSRFCVGK